MIRRPPRSTLFPYTTLFRSCAAGEECLAHDRVLDEIEHVGGVSPELGSSGLTQLVAEAPPGRLTVRAVAQGILGSEPRRDGLLHRLVHRQPVGELAHEGEVE